MLAAYQLDRARRNLSGYAVLGVPTGPALGVRTLRGLGAAVPISSADAMQQAIKLYGPFHLNPKQFQDSGWLGQAQAAIESAQISVSGGFGPDCVGVQAQPMNLVATAGGISLSAAGATTGILASTTTLIPAAAVPVIGWVIAGVGAIIGLISAIFQHHAQAVKRDLNFGCSAIPAVNNAFAVIRQAVQSGQMKPSDAAAALPEIYKQYMSAGGAAGSVPSGPSGIPGGGQPINDSPWCNSNCELSVVLLGMILFWQAQFAAMQSPAPASVAPIVSPVTASIPAQPGSGSAGSGPTAAPVVSSGSTLSMPAAAAPASALPSWIFLAAAAVVGLVAAEVL